MPLADLFAPSLAWLADNAVAVLSAAAMLIFSVLLSRFVYRAIKSFLPRAAGMDWDTLMVSERYMHALSTLP